MLPIGGDDRTRTYNLSFNRALLYAVELHPHIFQTSPLCRLSYPPLVIGARFELAPAKLFAVHKGVEPSPPGRQPGILHSLDQWTIYFCGGDRTRTCTSEWLPITSSFQDYCLTQLGLHLHYCGAGRIRTTDAGLFRPTLYQLSYSTILFLERGLKPFHICCIV